MLDSENSVSRVGNSYLSFPPFCFFVFFICLEFHTKIIIKGGSPMNAQSIMVTITVGILIVGFIYINIVFSKINEKNQIENEKLENESKLKKNK